MMALLLEFGLAITACPAFNSERGENALFSKHCSNTIERLQLAIHQKIYQEYETEWPTSQEPLILSPNLKPFAVLATNLLLKSRRSWNKKQLYIYNMPLRMVNQALMILLEDWGKDVISILMTPIIYCSVMYLNQERFYIAYTPASKKGWNGQRSIKINQ